MATETLVGRATTGTTDATGASGPVPGPGPGVPARPLAAAQRSALVVLVAGVLITAAVTAASRLNYDHNQRRLTSLQATLTAAGLAVGPIDVERRLGTALGPLSADGDVAAFRAQISSSLTLPFVSIVLLRVSPTTERVLARLGSPTLLSIASHAASDLWRKTVAAHDLVLSWLSRPRAQRFGYSMAATGPAGTFVAYAEQVFPADRRVTLPPGSPERDLRFAIYFGPRANPGDLVESTGNLPFSGPVVSVPVPFGNTVLTLVAAPKGPVDGTFAELIPWGIGAVGLLMAMLVSLMTERLVRRRVAAEILAAENRRLYQVQRSVSERLQRSLLPQRLPQPPQVKLAVRYLPGTAGIEVGGDWYDVVDVGDCSVFFTVGDVAGRGLEAAILMSVLRNAITAYALDGDSPGTVLGKLGRLVDVSADGRFATVLCGRLDTATGVATISNAGHLPPVIIEGTGCRFVPTQLGPPIGVGTHYPSIDVPLPPGSVLLAITDGLVERRGEPISAGLERLRRAVPPGVPLDEMLDRLVDVLVPAGPSDDIAILGVQWGA